HGINHRLRRNAVLVGDLRDRQTTLDAVAQLVDLDPDRRSRRVEPTATSAATAVADLRRPWPLREVLFECACS
ncbi:MAG: hypothetical protein DRJ50_02610, partial [Actinobacteria bacterium]